MALESNRKLPRKEQLSVAMKATCCLDKLLVTVLMSSLNTTAIGGNEEKAAAPF